MIISRGITSCGVQYEIDDLYAACGPDEEARIIMAQREVAFEILQGEMSA